MPMKLFSIIVFMYFVLLLLFCFPSFFCIFAVIFRLGILGQKTNTEN